MAITAVYEGLGNEEPKTVPSGGYIANKIVQATSGLAGYTNRPYGATAGEPTTIVTSGRVTLPCAAAVAAPAQSKVWWDTAGDTVVTYQPAAGFYLGLLAAEKVVTTETTAVVLLNATKQPVILTKTADYTATLADNGACFSNVGASGTITIALPAATPGQEYSGRVGVAQQLRFDPNGSETISLPSTGVPGAAGKYLTADAIGETVVLRCIVAGTWSVFGYTGTWTAEA